MRTWLVIPPVVISTMLSEYITRIIADMISGYYSAAGDAPLLLHGLLAVFIYRPLIAAGLATLVAISGWVILSRTTGMSFKEGYRATYFAALISGVVSFVWSCITVFVFRRLLPY
jgi:hypothetical protein